MHRAFISTQHEKDTAAIAAKAGPAAALADSRSVDSADRAAVDRGAAGRKARRGDIRTAALLLLAEEPRNGYQIMQEVQERSEGAWRPSPGSVYPALAQLEDEGLIRSEEIDGRKLFRLTDDGRAQSQRARSRAARAVGADERRACARRRTSSARSCARSPSRSCRSMRDRQRRAAGAGTQGARRPRARALPDPRRRSRAREQLGLR